MPKLSAHARARKIKLLLFDVDGVLTDGKRFIFPAPAGAQPTVLQQSAQHGGQGGFGLDSQTLIEPRAFTPTTARPSLGRAELASKPA